MTDLGQRLKIASARLDEINRKVREPGSLDNLTARLKEKKSSCLADLEWLTAQGDAMVFISLSDYRSKFPGKKSGALLRNDLDKHNTLNKTAEALAQAGTGVICARRLHA